jgi:hypothetical protein
MSSATSRTRAIASVATLIVDYFVTAHWEF